MSGIEELIKHAQGQCNRYVNGFCTTRKCFIRGGYSGSGPVGDAMATCEEHETALALATRSQSERERRLEEALKPFAMFALEGKRGGEFIICKGLFSDMKSWDDSPPRECHLHKDDFLRARSALNDGGSNG